MKLLRIRVETNEDIKVDHVAHSSEWEFPACVKEYTEVTDILMMIRQRFLMMTQRTLKGLVIPNMGVMPMKATLLVMMM
jgi:hypothetical protein